MTHDSESRVMTPMVNFLYLLKINLSKRSVKMKNLENFAKKKNFFSENFLKILKTSLIIINECIYIYKMIKKHLIFNFS